MLLPVIIVPCMIAVIVVVLWPSVIIIFKVIEPAIVEKLGNVAGHVIIVIISPGNPCIVICEMGAVVNRLSSFGHSFQVSFDIIVSSQILIHQQKDVILLVLGKPGMLQQEMAFADVIQS